MCFLTDPHKDENHSNELSVHTAHCWIRPLNIPDYKTHSIPFHWVAGYVKEKKKKHQQGQETWLWPIRYHQLVLWHLLSCSSILVALSAKGQRWVEWISRSLLALKLWTILCSLYSFSGANPSTPALCILSYSVVSAQTNKTTRFRMNWSHFRGLIN